MFNILVIRVGDDVIVIGEDKNGFPVCWVGNILKISDKGKAKEGYTLRWYEKHHIDKLKRVRMLAKTTDSTGNLN